MAWYLTFLARFTFPKPKNTNKVERKWKLPIQWMNSQSSLKWAKYAFNSIFCVSSGNLIYNWPIFYCILILISIALSLSLSLARFYHCYTAWNCSTLFGQLLEMAVSVANLQNWRTFSFFRFLDETSIYSMGQKYEKNTQNKTNSNMMFRIYFFKRKFVRSFFPSKFFVSWIVMFVMSCGWHFID